MNLHTRTTATEYIYTPLSKPQSIRVATLLPGLKTQPLRVTIQEHDLDDESLQYEAVSYCWGEVNRNYQVLCSERAIMVTENLIAALLRFRRPILQRVLWIDSVCIDQNAVDERIHQVKVMGSVYQKASRVLVWLGEEDSTTELAYSCLRSLSSLEESIISPKVEDKTTGILHEQSWDEFCESRSVPPDTSAEILAFEELLHRPWFSRAWVYQESSLARERLIVTGSHEIQGSSIPIVDLRIRKIQEVFGGMLYNTLLLNVVPVYYMFDPEFTNFIPRLDFWETLDFLLTLRRGAEAHDPRDIIHSLIGVASLNGSLELEPDYRIPWEDSYTSVAKKIIANTRRLNLLGSASERSGTSLKLPTWVPDWRQPVSSSRFSSVSHQNRVFKASGSSLVDFRHHDDLGKIQVRGVRYDEITQFCPFDENICDFLRRKGLIYNHFQFKNGWNFFTTSGGTCGFTPQPVKLGDGIFILLGAEVPIILRNEDNDTDYSLVGEGFVYGLMHGEGLQRARKIADPNSNIRDTSWLQRLHMEDLPFLMEYVVIK